MRKNLKWFLFSALFCIVFAFSVTYREMLLMRKKAKAYGSLVEYIDKGLWEALPAVGNFTFPIEMHNIPFAEKSGLVLNTKEITIRNVVAPYNPSLIKNEQGYLLFFRYDVIKVLSHSNYYSNIACVQLDKDFNQTSEEFKQIDTGSNYSEDPRAVQVGAEIYLFFNDHHPCGRKSGRTMRVAKFDPATTKLDFVTNLDLQLQHTEKNWVPFEYIAENNKPELLIEYFINPHKILRLADPKISFLDHLSFPGTSAFQQLFWPKMWGSPRGGTPALKFGDQYVSFFHSTFTDRRNFHWYLMAAYTFEAQAPFRVTSMSHFPILFEGVYQSPPMNTAHSNKQVVFPSGLSMEEKDGKTLFHVACGENDSAIKIVTIDGSTLLKSLKKL